MKYPNSRPHGLSATAAQYDQCQDCYSSTSGLQRLEAEEQEQRQRAIAQATADPSNAEVGVLVLEPVASEIRNVAAQKFAQIMQLDPTLHGYSTQSGYGCTGLADWRTALLGQNLRSAGVPCFWAILAEIQKIRVFQVSYFQSIPPQWLFAKTNRSAGSVTFNWSEVTQRVGRTVAHFEQVVISTTVAN